MKLRETAKSVGISIDQHFARKFRYKEAKIARWVPRLHVKGILLWILDYERNVDPILLAGVQLAV